MDETTSEILKSPSPMFKEPPSFGSDVMPTAEFPFSGGSKSTPSEIPPFIDPSEGPFPVFFVRSISRSGIIESKTFTVGSGKRPDDPSPECPPSGEIPYGITYCTDTDRDSMVDTLRENLKDYEEMFKMQYNYGGTKAQRHFVTPNRVFSMNEASSGIPWAGVYGIDEICVVTLSGHVDWKRVRGCLASRDSKTVLSIFRKCVLSELEDLADPSSELGVELKQAFASPFVVVSAGTPGTDETADESGHETSSVGYFPGEAVLFVSRSCLLQQVQDSGVAIKLAMSAFDLMMGRKCEPNEIEATVVSNRKHGYPIIKDLDICEIETIKD